MLSRELTAGEKRMIFKSVKKNCANYDLQYGCLLLDSDCYMTKIGFKDSNLCKYYEEAVLPMEPEIINIFAITKKDMKSCKVCGQPFIVSKNKRCCSDACSRTARRMAEAARAKRYRRKSR